MAESIFCSNPECGKELVGKNWMKAVAVIVISFIVLLIMAMCNCESLIAVKVVLISSFILFVLSLLMPGTYDIRTIDGNFRVCPYCGNKSKI